MSQLRRITIDPNVLGGRPCIRGLRMRVTDVLDMLAWGDAGADPHPRRWRWARSAGSRRAPSRITRVPRRLPLQTGEIH